MSQWLKVNTEFMNCFEIQYKDIPRKIIAEKFIECGKNRLDDYKIWCFEGKSYYVQYLSNRKNELEMVFFDTEWIRIFLSDEQGRSREARLFSKKENCG